MPESIAALIWILIFLFCIYKFRFFSAGLINKTWIYVAFIFSVALGFANYDIWLNVIGHGDSLRYFHDSKLVYNTLYSHPSYYFQLLVGHSTKEFVPEHLRYVTTELNIEWHVAEYNMVRILAVVNIFSFGSAWGDIVILSFISFVASLALFNVLVDKFKPGITQTKILFSILFFIPGFIFWRSGLLKEGPTFILLSILLIQLLRLENIFSYKRIFIIAITLLFLWMIRDYVFYLVLLNLFIWFAVKSIRRFKKLPLAGFSVFTILFVCIALLFSGLNENFNLAGFMQNEQKYFEIGSPDPDYSYKLLDGSNADLIKKIPYSLNNVLFRPNVFHSSSAFRIYQSAESMFVLAILLFCLIRFKNQQSSATVSMFLILSVELLLIYGIMVTDADTISRYRSIPFQFILLFAVLSYRPNNTLKK